MIARWTLLLAAGIGAAAWGAWPRAESHSLILVGEISGYLAPCGCTKPMTGGVRRLASACRLLTAGRPATLAASGGLVSDNGRQDQLKAEAVAEIYRHMGVKAVGLTDSDTRLGLGLVQAVRNLAGDVWVQSNLRESPTNEVARFLEDGPFLIGAAGSGYVRVARVLRETGVDSERAARDLVQQAADLGKTPILLLADDRAEAERLARAVPELRLIQYRSAARPAPEPVKIGDCLLVSPGEKGKYLLRLAFQDGKFTGYRAVELTPEYMDDPAASRVYRRYLDRVEKEDLLGRLPRAPGPAFAGTAKCGSCHAKAMKAWQASEHAHALRTLISDRHGRDPDCVNCHVVGLGSVAGFKSVTQTPQLANVGCESCHGPGALHAAKPKVKMGKAGAESCRSCHVPDHSPDFDFKTYWRRIAH